MKFIADTTKILSQPLVQWQYDYITYGSRMTPEESALPAEEDLYFKDPQGQPCLTAAKIIPLHDDDGKPFNVIYQYPNPGKPTYLYCKGSTPMDPLYKMGGQLTADGSGVAYFDNVCASEEEFIARAEKVYTFLTTEATYEASMGNFSKGIDPKSICFYGRSLGTPIAAYMGSQHPEAGGVVLIGPIENGKEAARSHLKEATFMGIHLPDALIDWGLDQCEEDLNTAAYLQATDIPIDIITGYGDIFFDQTERMFNDCRNAGRNIDMFVVQNEHATHSHLGNLEAESAIGVYKRVRSFQDKNLIPQPVAMHGAGEEMEAAAPEMAELPGKSSDLPPVAGERQPPGLGIITDEDLQMEIIRRQAKKEAVHAVRLEEEADMHLKHAETAESVADQLERSQKTLAGKPLVHGDKVRQFSPHKLTGEEMDKTTTPPPRQESEGIGI